MRFPFPERFINPYQYVGWSSEDAVKHYLTRISARIPQFQTMEEKDLNYIKVLAICSNLVPFLNINLTSSPDGKRRGKIDCQQL